jgi:excisionase family DNA binding protein
MLMHEWRQYRDRQVRKAVRDAREAQPEGAAEPAGDEAPAETMVGEEPLPLKSGPEKPKQVLNRLTLGNQDVRERLEALRARQQVLPLDVEQAEPLPSRSPRAVESREHLVQRLLDPVLTLEEAATLLDVCPTTVRRYTNRGVLKCYRTPGNQRRFRLSEVMAFMERRQMSREE